MGLKLLIFDLDGTLLDTLQDLADATNEALAEFGLPALPAENYKLMVGMGARVLMQRAAAQSSASHGISAPLTLKPEPDPDLLVDAFNRAYAPRWAVKTKPYEGVPAMLDRLADAGVALAILSNKPDAFTRKIAAHYFPDGPFKMVHGMRAGTPGKPDPALTREICRQFAAHPDEAALIGDSGSDMKTAVSAGVLPVGVLWGFRSETELRENGAQLMATSPIELADMLIRRI